MRINRICCWVIPILLTAAAACVHADAPTTRPTAKPTTQFASVSAVFESIPADKRPPEIKSNWTSLQLENTKEQVKSANRLLADGAVGQTVRIQGEVSDCEKIAGGMLMVEVTVDNPKDARVKCTFPSAMADKLLALGRGDQVVIEGTISDAQYEVDVLIFPTVNSILTAGDCRLVETKPK